MTIRSPASELADVINVTCFSLMAFISYGELGSEAILGALQSLFPKDEYDDTKTALKYSDYLSQVLIPESALLLIQEDLKIDRGEAIQVLGDSRKYGLMAFPADAMYSKEGKGHAGTSSKSALETPEASLKRKSKQLLSEKEDQKSKRARIEDQWGNGGVRRSARLKPKTGEP